MKGHFSLSLCTISTLGKRQKKAKKVFYTEGRKIIGDIYIGYFEKAPERLSLVFSLSRV